MGYPDSGQPKQKVFDPTPPKHITDECVFCKTPISLKVLEQPGIIHTDCHRPTCPDCIKDLKQTGLWGCWYCSTVDIDERNPEIQKELEKIREEKLRERQQPVERHRVDIPAVMTTDNSWTAGITTQPEWRAMANSDEYPYRDPPNPLDRSEGWGYVPDMDEEVKPGDFVQPSVDVFGKVEKWNHNKADVLGVIGSKVAINKVRGSIEELKTIAQLIMAGEKVDNKAFGKDESYGQIYGRIDWNATDTLAGYTLNEEAKSHIVAEIMKELEIYYTPFDSNKLKEEAQRGTGRTVQRVKSVFGHFIDGAVGLRKDFDSRRLLYLVDNVREARRINRVMTQEWEYNFYRKFDAQDLATIKKRVDIIPIKTALTGIEVGHYTLVIADITYAALAQDGDKINKMIQYIGAPVIGDVITG